MGLYENQKEKQKKPPTKNVNKRSAKEMEIVPRLKNTFDSSHGDRMSL
jgi:hypothetical protein